MDRTLWLLIGLRCRGWLRRLRRMLRSLKGILLALVGALVFVPLLFSLWSPALTPSDQVTANPDAVLRYGPLVLLSYCLTVLLFSPGERAITFTPAEVNFLFAGPFSRRQLLLYKIVGSVLNSVLGTLFLTLLFRSRYRLLTAAFVGLLLATVFVQLFAMVVALAAATVGSLAYNRARKTALMVVAVAVGGVVWYLGRGSQPFSLERLADLVNDAPVLSVLLAPLGWFTRAFAAERVWPDLVRWGGLGLAFDTVLAGLVLALDAQYLESAATASEYLYARLQRLRSGGMAAHWGAGTKARFTVPMLPWWGGAGPVAWRQVLTGLRSLKGLVVFLVAIGVMTLWPLFTRGADGSDPSAGAAGMAGGLLGMTVFMLPMMITFDFRGDLDRMDVLKALPLSAASVVVGQLATPAALISAIQVILVAVVQNMVGDVGWLLPLTVVFAPPLNFLMLAMENLVFLLFPTRMATVGSGDFQLIGRNILLIWAKLFILMVLVGLLTLVAALAYVLAGGSWPAALVTGWLGLAGADVGLVPAVALAFKKFDVARDTPP
jgi:hypothetical protein